MPLRATSCLYQLDMGAAKFRPSLIPLMGLAAVPWGAAQKTEFLQMHFAAQGRDRREQYPDTSFDVIVLDDQPVGRLDVARGRSSSLIMFWQLHAPMQGAASPNPARQQTLLSAGFRHRQGPANLPREVVCNFRMAGDRFNSTGGRGDPKGTRPAFSFQVAAVAPKVLQQAASFHLTITVSRSASGGSSPQAVFTAVSQNQRNRFGEALPRFFLGLALAVRAGNLRRIGDIPVAVALENGCELVVQQQWPPHATIAPTDSYCLTGTVLGVKRGGVSGAAISDWR